MSKVGDDRVVAVLCSDLHLSHNPPIARSIEGSWYDVQAKYLDWLSELCKTKDVPCIIAGDIFDKWNPPPSVIQLAMTHLPEDCYAVPGQHDLPNHSYDEMDRSAYGVLVEAGYIKNIEPDEPRYIDAQGLVLFGFPWGYEPSPPSDEQTNFTKLAVVHKYIWRKGSSYPGAPPEARISNVKGLDGYDAAVFGDNHKGFRIRLFDGGTSVMNCGTFFRRTIDEIDYEPRIGLLYQSGDIETVRLNVEEDQFLDVSEALGLMESALELGDLVGDFTKMASTAINLKDQLFRFLDNSQLRERVVRIIKEVAE